MNNFGALPLAVGTPANYNTGTNWEYLQISNESGYQLDLNFSGIGSRGFNPWQRDDVAIPKGYTGSLLITASNPSNIDPTTFLSSYVQVNGYIPGELAQPMSVALTRIGSISSLINSGNPLFSVSVGFGSTAFAEQQLNIFNPVNSRKIYTFYSCRAFTNSIDAGTYADLIIQLGADLNLAQATNPRSHSGTEFPPVSTAHCTYDDILPVLEQGYGVEVFNNQASVTEDFLSFPDMVTLAPGNNLRIDLIDSINAGGHVVRLTMKWSEA